MTEIKKTENKNVVSFTPEAVKDYLDRCIRFWRKHQDEKIKVFYIDAFQSVRVSLFGETLPREGDCESGKA